MTQLERWQVPADIYPLSAEQAASSFELLPMAEVNAYAFRAVPMPS